MRLELQKRPKSPIIIEGFPGFGLVSTIATEYIISHLNADQIGKIIFEELPPVVAVHKGTVIEPIGIFYSKKYNLVILHALTSVNGFEWKIAEHVVQLAKMLKAKEIISIEGIGSNAEDPGIYFLTNKTNNSAIIKKKTGLKELEEGIILGVTGALTLHRSVPTSCFFAETQSAFPDSRAAAKIISVLDKYLGLNVDTKPLVKKADEFEKKIKGIVEMSKDATETKQRKELSYLG